MSDKLLKTNGMTIFLKKCPDPRMTTVVVETIECGMEFTLNRDELGKFREMIDEAL